MKLQYFGHLIQRVDSLEKTLMLGKIEGRKSGRHEMVGWCHRLNRGEFDETLGIVKDREAWHAAVYRVTKSQTRLSD